MVLFTRASSLALHLLILLHSGDSFNAFAPTSMRPTAPTQHGDLMKLFAKRGPKTREKLKDIKNLAPEANDSAEICKLKSQLHYIKGQVAEANLRAAAAEQRVASLSKEKELKGASSASVEAMQEEVDWKQKEQDFKKREEQFKQRERELQNKLNQVVKREKAEAAKKQPQQQDPKDQEQQRHLLKQQQIEFQKREEEYKKREEELKNQLQQEALKKDKTWLVDLKKKEEEYKKKEEEFAKREEELQQKLKDKEQAEKMAAEKAAAIMAAYGKAASEATKTPETATEEKTAAEQNAKDSTSFPPSGTAPTDVPKNPASIAPPSTVNGSPVFPSAPSKPASIPPPATVNGSPTFPASPTKPDSFPPPAGVNGSPVFPTAPYNPAPIPPPATFNGPPTFPTVPSKPASGPPPANFNGPPAFPSAPSKPASVSSPPNVNGSPSIPNGSTEMLPKPASTAPSGVARGPSKAITDEADKAFKQRASWALKDRTDKPTPPFAEPARNVNEPESAFRQTANWAFRKDPFKRPEIDIKASQNPVVPPPTPSKPVEISPAVDPETAFKRAAAWASSPRIAITPDDPEVAFRRRAAWAKPTSTPEPVKSLENNTVLAPPPQNVIASSSETVSAPNTTVVNGKNKTASPFGPGKGLNEKVLIPEVLEVEEEPLSPFAEGTVNGWNMAAEGRSIGSMNATAGMPISTMKNENMFDKATQLPANVSSVQIDGGCLKTCSFTKVVERVELYLESKGRPLNSNIELWQGPNNTPQKMRVYSENGEERPFRAVIETPYSSNSIAIRNTAPLELPFKAVVDHTLKDIDGDSTVSPAKRLSNLGSPTKIQGRATHTAPCDPSVKSVQVMLQTDGCPLSARIELLQGPNNNKQVIEILSEDGSNFPFYAIIDTPGDGNVVRVINQGQIEFPLSVLVQPYEEKPVAETKNLGEGDDSMRWN